MYRDTEYVKNAVFREGYITCRIESMRFWYRVVFYSKHEKYGLVKLKFTLAGALALRDSVFRNRHSYGFS